jgi:trigger factor
MTDETTREETPATPHEHAPEAEQGGATATATAAPTEPTKLTQQVEIADVGPCKKHIKVTIDRDAIDKRMDEKFKELIGDANVSGFRPGKAPRRVVERRYQKDVGDQVKSEVLLASLQQLAEDHDIAPLAAPDLDPANIELPRQGPMVYEFDVEVRPQFDLPNYRGLKLRRPVHTFSEQEVEQEERRLLTPYGKIVPKTEGGAQLGDLIVVDAVISSGERQIGKLENATLRVDKQLAFKDGVAEHFGEEVNDAKAGDTREINVALSTAVADPQLRGTTVKAVLQIKGVQQILMPELTHEFLHTFGVHSPGQLRELVGVVLQRRLEHQQRQAARQQVIEHIAASSDWELPEDLLRRQARRAMARRIMEMRSDGISEEEIQGRRRLLEQNILQSTALSLKEHFVLQKIAEVEKIDVNDDDLNEEIERMAEQEGESPRRIRARLEREELLEALAAELIERRALDLILDNAEYEDVPLTEADQRSVATAEMQTVPGEIHDPTAEPPAAEETNPAT